MNSRTALAWVIGLPCSAFLIFILVMCLWEYRMWVGLSLLTLLFLVVGVFIRGMLTEQNLRIYRFDHTTETPLDVSGEPRFWRPDMKQNEHRQNGAQQMYYQGYRQD